MGAIWDCDSQQATGSPLPGVSGVKLNGDYYCVVCGMRASSLARHLFADELPFLTWGDKSESSRSLARVILYCLVGDEWAEVLVQAFVDDVVAQLPTDRPWKVSLRCFTRWLLEHEVNTVAALAEGEEPVEVEEEAPSPGSWDLRPEGTMQQLPDRDQGGA